MSVPNESVRDYKPFHFITTPKSSLFGFRDDPPSHVSDFYLNDLKLLFLLICMRFFRVNLDAYKLGLN